MFLRFMIYFSSYCIYSYIPLDYYSPSLDCPIDIKIRWWCPMEFVLPRGKKVPLKLWLTTHLVMVS